MSDDYTGDEFIEQRSDMLDDDEGEEEINFMNEELDRSTSNKVASRSNARSKYTTDKQSGKVSVSYNDSFDQSGIRDESSPSFDYNQRTTNSQKKTLQLARDRNSINQKLGSANLDSSGMRPSNMKSRSSNISPILTDNASPMNPIQNLSASQDKSADKWPPTV